MPSPASIVAAIVTGIGLGWVSIPHCLGMCGALHLTVSCIHAERPIRALAVFNIGRLVGYTVLGALAGGAGWVLNRTGRSCCGGDSGLAISALIPATCFLVLAIGAFRKRGVAGRVAPLLTRLLGRVGLFSSGCAASLLPCVVLYAALAAAIGTGGILQGAVVLFFFCLTITVVMQLVLIAGHGLHHSFKQRIEALLPYIFLALAILYGAIFFAKWGHLGA
jgi:sulfite exporter TauE/SafE